MDLNKFVLFLKNIKGMGDGTIRRLINNNCFDNIKLNNYEDIRQWLIKNHKFLSNKISLNNITIENLKIANLERKKIETINNELNIKYFSYFDSIYPKQFIKMKRFGFNDYPVLIFYKGNISLLNDKKICSIIGTRQPSSSAIWFEKDLVNHLVSRNCVILSGLAEGCDTIAHETCLKSLGKTIAVVGTGLDIVYPKDNIRLAEDILKNEGLIISEYSIGFKGSLYSFVLRDRLQAILAKIVIPIQTSINGGTMHACKDCKEKYNGILAVVSPKLVSDGDASGNSYLLGKYNANEIININDVDELLR